MKMFIHSLLAILFLLTFSCSKKVGSKSADSYSKQGGEVSGKSDSSDSVAAPEYTIPRFGNTPYPIYYSNSNSFPYSNEYMLVINKTNNGKLKLKKLKLTFTGTFSTVQKKYFDTDTSRRLLSSNYDFLFNSDNNTVVDMSKEELPLVVTMKFDTDLPVIIQSISMMSEFESSNSNGPFEFHIFAKSSEGQYLDRYYSAGNLDQEKYGLFFDNNFFHFDTNFPACDSTHYPINTGECKKKRILCTQPLSTADRGYCSIKVDGEIVNCYPSTSSNNCIHNAVEGNDICAFYQEYIEHQSQLIEVYFADNRLFNTLCSP